MYEAAWEEYRNRERMFWWVLIGGGVLAGVMIQFGSIAVVFAVPWLVGTAVTYLRKMAFPCPKCGNPFHMTALTGNPFARRCAHCGLRKLEVRGS